MIERHLSRAPVDVAAIARDLGINIYADDIAPSAGILRQDERLGGSSGYVILVQATHNLNRQRFTVAHEFGHFVLHRSDQLLEIKDGEFYRALSGPLETEANEFAARVLMPWGLVNSIVDEIGADIDEIARRLGVSKQALAIRLGIPYDQDWT